ncbi:unnamed protein product [Arctogadus glacialis]
MLKQGHYGIPFSPWSTGTKPSTLTSPLHPIPAEALGPPARRGTLGAPAVLSRHFSLQRQGKRSPDDLFNQCPTDGSRRHVDAECRNDELAARPTSSLPPWGGEPPCGTPVTEPHCGTQDRTVEPSSQNPLWNHGHGSSVSGPSVPPGERTLLPFHGSVVQRTEPRRQSQGVSTEDKLTRNIIKHNKPHRLAASRRQPASRAPDQVSVFERELDLKFWSDAE